MKLRYSLIFLVVVFILLFFNSFFGDIALSPDSLTAPTELFVLPLNSSALRLTWNDNGSGAAGFIVERRDLSSQNFLEIAVVQNSNRGLESFVDSSLLPNSSFEYRVISTDGVILSEPSNVFSATTKIKDQDLIFIPNFGTLDFLTLFTDFTSWQYVRSNLDGFGFFNHNLKTNPQCSSSICGNVNYNNLVSADAFTILKNLGLKVSIEVDVVKWHSCVAADRTVPLTQQLILNVENAGGKVDSLFMDQPYNGGQEILCQSSTGARIVGSCSQCTGSETCRTCGYDVQQSAFQTAQYIKAIKQFRPDIKIGDTEPHPKFSYSQLRDWVLALKAQNVTLDSFRLDTGFRPDYDLSSLSQIKNLFVSENIPYGVIYWAFVPSTFIDNSIRDREFFTRTLSWLNTVNDNNLDGSIQSFESWDTSPATSPYPGHTVPINLPEISSSVYSHTRLIRESLGLLLDNDARFVNQDVPLNIIAGQTYNVNVTFLNNGSQPWEENRLYSLGSVNPIDNNIWGFGRVRLEEGEIIYPGQQRKFSFFVTAPSNVGTYNFQWQMIQEAIERFGSFSNNINVNVMDPTIPNAPSNLIVTSISSSRLRLDWQDNSNNEMTFRVERRQLPNGVFAPLSTALNLPINTITFTDTGLPSGASFEYRVFAVNTLGNSQSSNVASGSTLLDIPNPPSNLLASTQSPSSIRLDWQDNSNNEYNFILSRRSIANGNPNPWFNISIPSNSNSYINSGLNPNVLYEFRILANNSAGQSSWSNSVSSTTFLCNPGSRRACSIQFGACLGAQETCTSSGTWPGCNSDTYEANNPSYNINEIGLCSDGIDNDCNSNGEFDYAGIGTIKGDNDCPVGVTAINAPSTTGVGSPFTLSCTSTVSNVRSVQGLVDSNLCSFVNWQGNNALFNCVESVYGAHTVRCNVNNLYSYQTGTNLNQQITIGGTCSSYSSSSSCENDNSCDWCTGCSGTFSSGAGDRCVNSGTCNAGVYQCVSGQCGATCDGTINGCLQSQICSLTSCGCIEQRPSITNIAPASTIWSSSGLLAINGQYFASDAQVFVNGLQIADSRLTKTSNLITLDRNAMEFNVGQNSLMVRNPLSGFDSVIGNFDLTSNPSLTSIIPNMVLNNLDTVVDLNGDDFDPLSKVMLFGVVEVPPSFVTYINPQLIKLELISGLEGADYEFSVLNGAGTVLSNSLNLRINYPFDYVLSTSSSQYNLNPGDIISGRIKVEALQFMQHENISFVINDSNGLNVVLLNDSCQIDISTTPYPSCEIEFIVQNPSVSSGSYVVRIVSNSSDTFVSHDINITIIVNSVLSGTGNPSSGGGSGSSGGGTGGNGTTSSQGSVRYQCNDGIDNDKDGKTDYPLDLGCSSPNDNSELAPNEIVDESSSTLTKGASEIESNIEGVEIRFVFWIVFLSLMVGIFLCLVLIINFLRKGQKT